MNFIRRRLKFLMWVVAIGFVGGLFFIGGRRFGPSWIASILPASLLSTMPGCARSAGILMKVGNYNVGLEEFKRVRENIVEIARYQYKDNFEAYAENMDFDKQTVEAITKYAILLQESDKHKIHISDDEIQNGIKEFPFNMPQEAESRVRPFPFYSFAKTKDGNPNPVAFRRLLEREGKITQDQFSQEVKNGLRIARLKSMIVESAIVTDLEVKSEYRKQNEKAKIKYIEVPFRDFNDKIQVSDSEINEFFKNNILDYKLNERVNISFVKIDPMSFVNKVNISDAEIARYYKTHQSDYFEPEKVKARHILVQVDQNATKEEKEKAKAYAEKILKEAKDLNADFDALAKKYSKEPFTVKHEDLGYFERGKMVKPFEDAAFNLTPVSVSNVVETNFGYHIIKVEDKKAPQGKSMEEARDEIVQKLSEEQAVVLARQKADDIQYTVISEENLQSAVDANPNLNLQVMETGFFAKGDTIPNIGSSYIYRNLVDEAFKLKVGEISNLIEVKAYGDKVLGYFIIKLIGKKPAVIPKLEEVKDKVTRDLKDKKAKDLAKIEADNIMTIIKSTNNLEEVAEKNNLKISESEPFSLSSGGYIRSEGGAIDSKKVMLEAFSKRVGEIAGPYEGRNGFYIIQVTERQPVDDNKIAQNKDEVTRLRDQLIKQKQQKIFDTWYQKMRSSVFVKSFYPNLASS